MIGRYINIHFYLTFNTLMFNLDFSIICLFQTWLWTTVCQHQCSNTYKIKFNSQSFHTAPESLYWILLCYCPSHINKHWDSLTLPPVEKTIQASNTLLVGNLLKFIESTVATLAFVTTKILCKIQITRIQWDFNSNAPLGDCICYTEIESFLTVAHASLPRPHEQANTHHYWGSA